MLDFAVIADQPELVQVLGGSLRRAALIQVLICRSQPGANGITAHFLNQGFQAIEKFLFVKSFCSQLATLDDVHPVVGANTPAGGCNHLLNHVGIALKVGLVVGSAAHFNDFHHVHELARVIATFGTAKYGFIGEFHVRKDRHGLFCVVPVVEHGHCIAHQLHVVQLTGAVALEILGVIDGLGGFLLPEAQGTDAHSLSFSVSALIHQWRHGVPRTIRAVGHPCACGSHGTTDGRALLCLTLYIGKLALLGALAFERFGLGVDLGRRGCNVGTNALLRLARTGYAHAVQGVAQLEDRGLLLSVFCGLLVYGRLLLLHLGSTGHACSLHGLQLLLEHLQLVASFAQCLGVLCEVSQRVLLCIELLELFAGGLEAGRRFLAALADALEWRQGFVGQIKEHTQAQIFFSHGQVSGAVLILLCRSTARSRQSISSSRLMGHSSLSGQWKITAMSAMASSTRAGSPLDPPSAAKNALPRCPGTQGRRDRVPAPAA